MRVAVGGENSLKLSATERALGARAATVEAVGVDSGVPDQPRGHDETSAGAQNRTEAALDSGSAVALGVGTEGGVAELPRVDGGERTWADEVGGVAGASDLYLVMWAAVADGARTTHGAGPALRLPERVASLVRDGRELGPVLADSYDAENVGTTQGAAGMLTDGIVDRESALVHAVAAALGPHVTDYYEG